MATTPTRCICSVVMYLSVCFIIVQASKKREHTSRSKAVVAKVVVDRSGKGDYDSIQDAIDAVPSGNSRVVHIRVKPGVYKEKVVVPLDKPLITLSGTKASKTIVTWHDGGDIFHSPTFTVLAPDFTARRLTIQNTSGHGRGRAVALRVSGDRVAFVGCRILAYQDTLLDDRGRHYYRNCYIEGATDFICGNGASLFEKCHLHSLSRGRGAITAQHRASAEEDTGFTFINCSITGVKSALLGRPWGAYSRVVFAKSYMSSVILPQGWDDWGHPSRQRTAYFGQYECYGAGAKTSTRVHWARTLSAEEAAPYLGGNLIGGRSWIRSTKIHGPSVSGHDQREFFNNLTADNFLGNSH